MIHPRRRDGKQIALWYHPNGDMYADMPTRLGEVERHFHVWQDYDLLCHERCYKCGLLRIRESMRRAPSPEVPEE